MYISTDKSQRMTAEYIRKTPPRFINIDGRRRLLLACKSTDLRQRLIAELLETDYEETLFQNIHNHCLRANKR